MITTDFEWLSFFEKAGCTGGILKRAEIAVDEIILHTQNAGDILSEEAKSDFTKRLYRRLFGLYNGVLCELIKEKTGDVEFTLGILCSEPNNASPELLLAANEIGCLLDQDSHLLSNRYPVLIEKEEKVVGNFKNATIELLKRYATRREEISKNIFKGNDAGKIMSVLDMVAISRQHGRSVTGLCTEQGVIYYKPHSCVVDLFFAEIIEDYFSDITIAPTLAAGDNYAFCSQVKPYPVEDKEEIGRYFYRFGALNALIKILGGMDVHRGNVIANGGFPTIIDIENLMTPDEKGESRKYTVADNDVENSVIRISCLPHRDYLERHLASSLHNYGDAADYLPEYEGKKYEITGFEEEFIRGFSDGYDRAVRHSEGILSALEKYPDMQLRYLYNSPGTHNYILGKLVAPQSLTSLEAQKEVVKRTAFSLKQRTAFLYKKILDYEERHLLEGDVPYYYAKLYECSLYGADGLLAEDIFASSPFDHIKTQMGMLGAKDKEMQLGIIRHTFESALYDEDAYVYNEKIKNKELEDSEVISEVKRIYDFLHSEKMYTSDGTVFFLSSMEAYYMQGRWGLAALQQDVILFCSVILMSPGLHEIYTDCASLRDECLDALDAKVILWGKEGIPAEVPVGVRFGLGGMILALSFAKRTGSEKAASILERLLRLANAKPAASPQLSGFLKGNAGLLYSLCRVTSRNADVEEGRRKVMLELAEELVKSLPQNKESLFDLAGIGMSLVYAGKSLGNETYIYAGTKIFQSIYDSRDAKKLSAGVGYFAASALAILEDNEDTIWRCMMGALECEMREDALFWQDVIENGNVLRVSFLMRAERYAPSYGCKQRAAKILSAMTDRKNMTGEYISYPEKTRNHFDASFFTGTLGVGAAMCNFLGLEEK